VRIELCGAEVATHSINQERLRLESIERSKLGSEVEVRVETEARFARTKAMLHWNDDEVHRVLPIGVGHQ
jgi:hypothetical protein